MKRWYRCIVPVVLGATFCCGYVSPKDRQYMDYFLRLQAADLFRSKSFLLEGSSAYVSRQQLERVEMKFSYYRILSVNKARELIISVAQDLIEKINSDSSIREKKLLSKLFTESQLYIEIRTDNLMSRHTDVESIQRIILSRGTITYQSYPASRLLYGRSSVYKESWEQALMFLDLPTEYEPDKEKIQPKVVHTPFSRKIEAAEMPDLLVAEYDILRKNENSLNILGELQEEETYVPEELSPEELSPKELIPEERDSVDVLSSIQESIEQNFPDLLEPQQEGEIIKQVDNEEVVMPVASPLRGVWEETSFSDEEAQEKESEVSQLIVEQDVQTEDEIPLGFGLKTSQDEDEEALLVSEDDQEMIAFLEKEAQSDEEAQWYKKAWHWFKKPVPGDAESEEKAEHSESKEDAVWYRDDEAPIVQEEEVHSLKNDEAFPRTDVESDHESLQEKGNIESTGREEEVAALEEKEMHPLNEDVHTSDEIDLGLQEDESIISEDGNETEVLPWHEEGCFEKQAVYEQENLEHEESIVVVVEPGKEELAALEVSEEAPPLSEELSVPGEVELVVQEDEVRNTTEALPWYKGGWFRKKVPVEKKQTVVEQKEELVAFEVVTEKSSAVEEERIERNPIEKGLEDEGESIVDEDMGSAKREEALSWYKRVGGWLKGKSLAKEKEEGVHQLEAPDLTEESVNVLETPNQVASVEFDSEEIVNDIGRSDALPWYKGGWFRRKSSVSSCEAEIAKNEEEELVIQVPHSEEKTDALPWYKGGWLRRKAVSTSSEPVEQEITVVEVQKEEQKRSEVEYFNEELDEIEMVEEPLVPQDEVVHAVVQESIAQPTWTQKISSWFAVTRKKEMEEIPEDREIERQIVFSEQPGEVESQTLTWLQRIQSWWKKNESQKENIALFPEAIEQELNSHDKEISVQNVHASSVSKKDPLASLVRSLLENTEEDIGMS